MATFAEMLKQNLVNNISGTSPLVPGMQGGDVNNTAASSIPLPSPQQQLSLVAGQSSKQTMPMLPQTGPANIQANSTIADPGNFQLSSGSDRIGPANPYKFTYNKDIANPFGMIPIASTGWKPEIQSQLIGLGINEIPEWMKVYGVGSNYETSDLAQGVQRALNIDPAGWLSTAGKRQNAMHNIGVMRAENGKIFDWRGNEIEWSPENKAAAQQLYLNRLTKENYGGFNPLGGEGLGMAFALLPAALMAGYALAPAAGAGAAVGEGAAAGVGEAATGAGAAGLGGATAAGAGETAAMGTAALSAGLPASVGTTAAMGSVPEMIAASSAIFGSGLGSMLGELGAYGLGELGSLISGGADLFSGMDIGKLIGNGTNLGNLIGGGTPGGIIAAPTTIQGGSTSAPQTSQIIPGGPAFNPQSVITPAAMPTSSIMGAFGNSDTKEPEYLKYFTSLF